jgi:hypothetical protein
MCKNVHSVVLCLNFEFATYSQESLTGVTDRFARFFLVQHSKTGKIQAPNAHKIYQMTIKYTTRPNGIPNDHNIYKIKLYPYQITIKIYQTTMQFTKRPYNIQSYLQIYQMAQNVPILHTTIFKAKAFQNISKVVFWYVNIPSGNPGSLSKVNMYVWMHKKRKRLFCF